MTILMIHNKYGKLSGEEMVVNKQIELLEKHGHKVVTYFRESSEIKTMPLGKIKAFFLALYNPKSMRDLKQIVAEHRPDVVHVHNLFPLISPAILPFLKKMGLPIVMSVHNYRLMCPNGLFLNQNTICEKCTGKWKETQMIINNCEQSITKSVGYALRHYWARKKKYFLKNVDQFLCLKNFQKEKLIANGFPAERIALLQNTSDAPLAKKLSEPTEAYVAYIGRISNEKGISLILQVAKMLPEVRFKLAGGASPTFRDNIKHYKNVELVGFLNREASLQFLRQARFFISPSIWYEGFPMTSLEAMSQKKAIIATDIGGISEIIIPGETGLLFKKSDIKGLKNNIQHLIEHPDIAEKMGENGYKRLNANYRSDKYYQKLIAAYKNQVL